VNQLNVEISVLASSFTASKSCNGGQALPELDSSPPRELAGDILWEYEAVRLLEPGACDTRTGISCYGCVCQQSACRKADKKRDDTDWKMFINSRRNSLIRASRVYW